MNIFTNHTQATGPARTTSTEVGNSSNVLRTTGGLMAVFLGAVMMLVGAQASAQYTFPAPSNVSVTNPNYADITLNVASVPAGSYGTFTVTADWTDGFDAWSSEAQMEFNFGALFPLTAPTSGAGNNATPTTLTWTGSFTSPYTGGNPLTLSFFTAWQGSTANFSNISVTINPVAAGGGGCAVTPPACVETASAAYDTVITGDPWCCDNQWDNLCQDDYDALNSSCLPPPPTTLFVPFSGNNTITECSGTVTDHAGIGNNYANNANGWLGINPGTPGEFVQLDFTAFALECCCDFVRVFDGIGTGGTQLFFGNCTTIPGPVVSLSGPLTIQFTSDGSVVNTGFVAEISCVAPPSCLVTPPACVDVFSAAYDFVITDDPWCCDNEWDNLCQDDYDALNNSCAPVECQNSNAFGIYPAPTQNLPPTTLSTCVYQNEYHTINGIQDGETYVANYSLGGNPNGWITVRSGTPGGPVVASGNAPLTWTATVTGTHYFHFNTNDACGTATSCGTSTLQCTTCPPPPPIAWCETATSLTCDATVTGTTVGAPTTAVPATCVTTNGTGGKVAFTYTGTGSDIVVNTAGSGFDTKLWVFTYNASCQPGDLVCVTGNDDFTGIGTQSQVQFNAAAGVEYLIIVGGFGTAQGNYTLNSFCTLGCTNPMADNYDPAASFDDGSCTVNHDTSTGALQLSSTALGTCSPVSQDINLASTNQGGTIGGFGNDLWFTFNAVTSGVRIETTTTTFDVVLELFDAALTPIAGVDQVFVNGGEVLNYGGLTAGDDYLVRVAAWGSGGGSRPFDICVQFLPETQCDYAVGVTTSTRSLCQNAKAKWVGGANNYIFHFTPQGGGSTITYETGAAFTIAPLQNVPGLLWGETYDVQIDLGLSLTNSNGNPEQVTIESSNACELVITPAPVAALRASDNLTNAGPLQLGRFIAAVPFICTTSEWEWVFANTDGSQLPITHFSGAPSRFLRLLDVDGLEAGAVYDVQVRPVFATGAPSQFGAVDQIAIIGALGLEADVLSPVVNEENIERLDDVFETAGIALYPNPNRGDFMNVNITGIEQGVDRVLVDIYDMMGKRVTSEQLAVGGSSLNIVMPLNGLADGMYIVNIIMDGKVHTERMIVQK